MQLTATKLSSSEYAEKGVSAQAESAYILTASVTPADAGNKAVDWAIGFKNANATWASGKTVTDYVTVTPTSEGSLTANYFEIEATEQFKDYITNVAKFDASQLPKWTSTDTEYESRRRLSAFFDENWGAALHGGEAAKRNALINALLRFGEEPAYRIRLLDRPNGTEAAVFTLVINPELLANQLQAESIKIDQSGVTF